MFQAFKTFIRRVVYNNDWELLQNPYKTSRDRFILQIILATAFTSLTGGVFLTGFAVFLGLRDQLISYITILPNLCGLALVVSGVFWERFRRRKFIICLMVLVSKLLICSIVLLPRWAPRPARPGILVGTLVIAFTLQAFYNVALNAWFVGVVPENIRGRFFAIRQTFALLVTVALPILTGRLMDLIQDKYSGFLILYGVGMLAALIEILIYFGIEEPVIEMGNDSAVNPRKTLRLPLKDRIFRDFVLYIFTFYTILWVAHSFTQVFLIRYLRLSYTFLNALAILGAVLQMIFYRLWGRIGDRYGHRLVINLSIWFFVGETFFYAMTTPKTAWIWLPVAYSFSALGNSGFLIGVFNERFAIIPEQGRVIYDGFYNMAVGIAFLVAPFIGGGLKDLLAASAFIRDRFQFGEFRWLYLISSLGVALLQLGVMLVGKQSRAGTITTTKMTRMR